jgi:hypothetical protein
MHLNGHSNMIAEKESINIVKDKSIKITKIKTRNIDF